jgi:hypothetical protein
MSNQTPLQGITSNANPATTTKDGIETITSDPHSEDRFLGQLQKIQSTSAFGVYVPDVLKAKSGIDYSRDIQFSIRREFWTFSQVRSIAYWSLSIGAVVGAGVVAGFTPNGFPDIFGPGAMMIWGVFLLALGLSGMWSEGKAKSNIRHCTKKTYGYKDPKGKFESEDFKVEPSFQGKDCLTDWDCTRKSNVPKGVCAVPEQAGITKVFRKGVLPIIVLVGAVMTGVAFSSTDFRLAKKDLAQAIIYGIGIGIVLVLIFS